MKILVEIYILKSGKTEQRLSIKSVVIPVNKTKRRKTSVTGDENHVKYKMSHILLVTQ